MLLPINSAGNFICHMALRMHYYSRQLSALMLAIHAPPNATSGWQKRVVYALTTPMTPQA
ncbi:hypothetical protein EA14781_049_00210 [Escherichia albertii NBRC 107761 = DSM 17582]|nr:hypothetical protein EA14781_049_00210 [Escherichia albertii NBRC 107761 = DSM 17582]